MYTSVRVKGIPQADEFNKKQNTKVFYMIEWLRKKKVKKKSFNNCLKNEATKKEPSQEVSESDRNARYLYVIE